jgi:PAS domain S-box-containing protein
MNFLDIRTVIISQVLTDTICCFVLAFLWRQDRSRFKGMGYWLLDFICQTLAVLLISLRGIIPDCISLGFPNPLVVAGAILGYIGITKFLEIRITQIPNVLFFFIIALLNAYFAFVHISLEARDLLVSFSLVVVCGQCFWFLFKRVEHARRPLTREIGVVFVVFVLVSLVRIIILLVHPDLTNDFFKSGIYETIILMIFQLLLILLTFSFSLMVNRRLLIDMKFQEEKYTRAFRSSPYAITLTRISDGKILEVNDGFFAITGYTPDEVVGKTTLDLHLWEKEEERTEVVHELSRGNKVAGREARFRKKSGALLTGLFSAEVIPFNEELWVVSSINDISDRIIVEKEKSFLANTIEASLNEIYICDAKTWRFQFVNQGALNNLGFSLQQMKKKTPLDIKPDFTRASYKSLISPLINGSQSKIIFETRHRRADGTHYPVEVHMQAFLQPHIGYFLAFVQDITERKKTNANIRHATEELRRRNEELEHFNKAAVGRELRMVELKKEINDLNNKLGKSAPYPVGSKKILHGKK